MAKSDGNTKKRRFTQAEIAADLAARIGRDRPFDQSNVARWQRLGAPVYGADGDYDGDALESWYRSNQVGESILHGSQQPIATRNRSAERYPEAVEYFTQSLFDLICWAPEAIDALVADENHRLSLLSLFGDACGSLSIALNERFRALHRKLHLGDLDSHRQEQREESSLYAATDDLVEAVDRKLVEMFERLRDKPAAMADCRRLKKCRDALADLRSAAGRE